MRRHRLLSRVEPARLIAGIFAAIIVCSLVFAGLGPVVLDRVLDSGGNDGQPGSDAETETNEFEQVLRARVAEHPEDAASMVSLANLLATRGEYPEAIDWYERALEIDPDNVEYRLDFGLTLVEARSLADAEAQYRRVIALDGGNADGHFLLAELYRGWQPPRTDEAVEHYRRAMAVAPGSVSAERAAEELRRLGRSVGTPAATPVTPIRTGTPEAAR